MPTWSVDIWRRTLRPLRARAGARRSSDPSPSGSGSAPAPPPAPSPPPNAPVPMPAPGAPGATSAQASPALDPGSKLGPVGLEPSEITPALEPAPRLPSPPSAFQGRRFGQSSGLAALREYPGTTGWPASVAAARFVPPSEAVDINPFDVLQLGPLSATVADQVRRASDASGSVPGSAQLKPVASHASGTTLVPAHRRASGARASASSASVGAPHARPGAGRMLNALDFNDVVQDHVLCAAARLRHPTRSTSASERPPWAKPVSTASSGARSGPQPLPPHSHSVMGLSGASAHAHARSVSRVQYYRRIMRRRGSSTCPEEDPDSSAPPAGSTGPPGSSLPAEGPRRNASVPSLPFWRRAPAPTGSSTPAVRGLSIPSHRAGPSVSLSPTETLFAPPTATPLTLPAVPAGARE